MKWSKSRDGEGIKEGEFERGERVRWSNNREGGKGERERKRET